MKQLQEILRPLLAKLRSGRKTVEISELWGASKALFLIELFRESKKPLLLVTSSEDWRWRTVLDTRGCPSI